MLMSEEVGKSLHRLKDNKNDWDDLLPEQLNRWQKIAKKTKGLVTAANGITLFGTVAVINGITDFSSGRKAEGTAKIIGGRLCDIADGYVADTTGTKGKVGRVLDPTVDFIQMGVALPMLEQAGAIPLAAAIAVGVPKVADAVGTVAGTLRKREMNPTKEGKYSITAIWTGIGAFVLKSAMDKHIPGYIDTALEVVGWTGTVGGSIAHLPATFEYNKIGFGGDNILPAQNKAA